MLFPVSIFAVFSRFWLSAWLCVFCCIKIVNSIHFLFLWCKLRISWLVPHLIAGSLLISIFGSLEALEMDSIHLQNNITTMVPKLSQGKLLRASDLHFQFFLEKNGSCSPLFIVLLCSTLVVASPFRHVCWMTGKDIFRGFQSKAHIEATGTVFSLLLIYLSCFVIQTLSMTTDTYTERFFVSAAMMAYGLVQAAILVLRIIGSN
ncbi:taste receptor type 2 member 40-like [Anolis carolinensis]|uniref:taste receptor type 2 member 40-like n=1 Tax=Anolis carolinensis TaxID=28377 RepID=UPI002F2B2E27